MEHYVTGATIRALREGRKMTQADLARQLCVSDKAISKWETGRGLPDLTLLAPLAQALHVSVPELLSGQVMVNTNRASNMLRSRLYVCPVCGNVICTKGEALVSCCGIMLPALEAEEAGEAHEIQVERIEDELFISMAHEMSKEHFISFFALVTPDRVELKTLYPEGNAEARLPIRRGGVLYGYCNRHGLFRRRV